MVAPRAPRTAACGVRTFRAALGSLARLTAEPVREAPSPVCGAAISEPVLVYAVPAQVAQVSWARGRPGSRASAQMAMEFTVNPLATQTAACGVKIPPPAALGWLETASAALGCLDKAKMAQGSRASAQMAQGSRAHRLKKARSSPPQEFSENTPAAVPGCGDSQAVLVVSGFLEAGTTAGVLWGATRRYASVRPRLPGIQRAENIRWVSFVLIKRVRSSIADLLEHQAPGSR